MKLHNTLFYVIGGLFFKSWKSRKIENLLILIDKLHVFSGVKVKKFYMQLVLLSMFFNVDALKFVCIYFMWVPYNIHRKPFLKNEIYSILLQTILKIIPLLGGPWQKAMSGKCSSRTNFWSWCGKKNVFCIILTNF